MFFLLAVSGWLIVAVWLFFLAIGGAEAAEKIFFEAPVHIKRG